MYELRGIQRCKALIEAEKKIEGELLNLGKEVQGPFLSRPEDEFKFIGATGAAWVIYPTVLLAWIYVAGVGLRWW